MQYVGIYLCKLRKRFVQALLRHITRTPQRLSSWLTQLLTCRVEMATQQCGNASHTTPFCRDRLTALSFSTVNKKSLRKTENNHNRRSHRPYRTWRACCHTINTFKNNITKIKNKQSVLVFRCRITRQKVSDIFFLFFC